jgi:hypothetical protein
MRNIKTKASTGKNRKKLVVRKTALKNLTVRTEAKPAARWTMCPVCGSY